VEDDEHLLFGCAVTGTVDWMVLLQEAWAAAAVETKANVAAPTTEWLQGHRWQLMAAIIPASVATQAVLPPARLVPFCKKLHLKLALQTAERLRRRQVIAGASGGSAGRVAPT
jgi:hypothetical protein